MSAPVEGVDCPPYAEVEAIRTELAAVRRRIENLDAFANGYLRLAADAAAGALTCVVPVLDISDRSDA